MAKVKLNTALHALQGNVDNWVYKKYGKNTVLSRRPNMDGIKPSPAQLAQRARFRAASEFYHRVLDDPILKRRYAALAKKRGVPLSAITLAAHMQQTAKP